jgi:predicted Zn-dependent protease
MLSQNQASDISNHIKKLSTAEEVEVLFSGGQFALTRFANNTIHQNVAEENHVVSVRAAFGGKTARAFTNKFDEESLRQVVRSAESLARVQHPDPDLLPMPDSQEASGRTGEAPLPARTVPCRHFEETAGITPEVRADGVKKIVGVAEKHGLTSAGVFSSGESFEGIFNSRGLSKWHAQTSAEVSITMLGSDSSGWQKSNSPDVGNLDPRALAETAAQKAVDSAHPREIPAGKYTVILEPAAVLDIVGFMFWDYSGMSILDQRSFLNGRIGTNLFGGDITTMWGILCRRALPSMERGCSGSRSVLSKTE